MKRIAAPCLILLMLFILTLTNSQYMAAQTTQWSSQLKQVDEFVQHEQWEAALETLQLSYASWSDHQTYLHVVAQHAAVDEAETLYRRCIAFCQSKEPAEIRAELAQLRNQLRLLSELERLLLKNVL